jgi:two-component system response regulator NreC
MRILVVEDQTLVRELLVFSCRDIRPGSVVHGVGTCAAALEEARRRQPDLILLDLVLPDGDGIELAQPLLAAAPRARLIALSSHVDEFTLHRALASKIHGILDKNEQPVRILREAMDEVLAGRRYLSSAVQRLRANLRADPAAFDKILSDREQAVLRLVGEGLDNEAVAARLKISPSTAKNHRLNIMAKLDLHSTPQLIRYAIEKGFTRLRE